MGRGIVVQNEKQHEAKEVVIEGRLVEPEGTWFQVSDVVQAGFREPALMVEALSWKNLETIAQFLAECSPDVEPSTACVVKLGPLSTLLDM